MNKIIILLLLSLLFAESFIYVGQDNDGKLMAGVVNRIYPQYPNLNSYVESDIRSTGIELINEGYNPKVVTYYFKAYCGGIYFKHSCKHVLDKINLIPENIDIIGFELKI
jgi:hypothetical protein